ncbi:MAG: hypothetical protein ACM3WU_00320 [Bacillota bacterium]
MMDTRDLVLAIVGSCPDHKVPGRTILQKIVYFCSVILKLEVDYFPHYYGPYSEEVSQAVKSLSALGFISESKHMTNTGLWGYDYQLTKDGTELFSSLSTNPTLKRVADVVSKILSLEGWNHTQTISCAAKVNFILHRNNQPMTREAISKEAEGLGWKLDAGTISSVVSFLESLNLVTTG